MLNHYALIELFVVTTLVFIDMWDHIMDEILCDEQEYCTGLVYA